jgi:hypothetical protein
VTKNLEKLVCIPWNRPYTHNKYYYILYRVNKLYYKVLFMDNALYYIIILAEIPGVARDSR